MSKVVNLEILPYVAVFTEDSSAAVDIKLLYPLSANKINNTGVAERAPLRTCISPAEVNKAGKFLFVRRLTKQHTRMLGQLHLKKPYGFRNTDFRRRKRFNPDSGTTGHLNESTRWLICMAPP